MKGKKKDMSVPLTVLLVLALCGAIVFSVYPKTTHPVKNALFGAATGGAGLLVVNLTSGLAGVMLACNLYTVSASLILGLPGVVLLLVLRLLR